jgi:uncharacterized delta-60 repeat protein
MTVYLKATLLSAAACAAVALTSAQTANASSLAPDVSFDAPEFVRPYPASRSFLLPDGKFLRHFSLPALSDQPTAALTRHFADGSLDPSFRIEGKFDSVGAVAALPDGRLIISATEREYHYATERILRLNADGSVDSTFKSPVVNTFGQNTVQAVVVAPDGGILITGSFDQFDGVNVSDVVRLLPDGTRDTGFGPVFATNSSGGFALGPGRPAVQPDGKIIIVGSFRRVNGQNYPLGVARLNPNGSLDAGFQPSGFTRIGTNRDPIVQPDGKIIIGGLFSVPANFAANPTGATYSNLPLIRLEPNGAVDQSYGYFDKAASTMMARSLAQQGEKILAVDSFQRTVFRFNTDGTRDATFRQPVFLINRTTSFRVTPISISVLPDDRVLISGIFTDVDDETGPANGLRFGVARFDANGTLDPTFTTPERTALKDYPVDFARLADGTTLVAFRGTAVTGDTALPHNFGRLRPDGSVDTAYDPFAAADPNGSFSPNFAADGLRLLQDGKVFLFGRNGGPDGPFTYGRLAADGTVDAGFVADQTLLTQFAGAELDTVVAQPGGKIVIGGLSAQGVLYGLLRRIDVDGSLDSSFAEQLTSSLVVREEGTQLPIYIDGTARMVGVQPDGKLLFVRGSSIRRLNSDGSIDNSFAGAQVNAPSAFSITFPQLFDPLTGRTLQPAEGVLTGNAVLDAAVQPDGRIVIVGAFTAPMIARLNADGTLDESFKPGAGGQWTQTSAQDGNRQPVIEQVEVQNNGKLLVAGTFEAFNGVPAPGIVSLNTDGSVDTSFVAPAVRQKSVGGRARLERQADGSFLLSGPYSYPAQSSAPSLLRIASSSVANISTRMAIGTGENVLIGGFIVTGSGAKKVMLRAIGPSLRSGNDSLSGRLEDPVMELRDGAGELVLANDNWRGAQEQEIIASQIAPQDDREAAIIATLQPGAYTATVSGKAGSTGIGLVEIYDLGNPSLDPANNARLANISTRGLVQTGDNVMIGGFIATGASSRLIVRAVGPSLSGSGVAGALQDTTLELVNGDGTVIASNDDWRTGGQEQQIIDSTLPPKDNRESAVVAAIDPGAYTAVVRGKNNTQGVALIEVYVLQ